MLLPRHLFSISNIFNPVLFDEPALQNANAYPTVRNNQSIRQTVNVPTIEQRRVPAILEEKF